MVRRRESDARVHPSERVPEESRSKVASSGPRPPIPHRTPHELPGVCMTEYESSFGTNVPKEVEVLALPNKPSLIAGLLRAASNDADPGYHHYEINQTQALQ